MRFYTVYIALLSIFMTLPTYATETQSARKNTAENYNQYYEEQDSGELKTTRPQTNYDYAGTDFSLTSSASSRPKKLKTADTPRRQQQETDEASRSQYYYLYSDEASTSGAARFDLRGR